MIRNGLFDRMRAWAEPVHEWSVGRVRPIVNLVAGVTLLLLVIAGFNVASLLLAQTAPGAGSSRFSCRWGRRGRA